MCGIAGFYDKRREIKDYVQRIKIMTDSIEHRGPDAEGNWNDEGVSLGHRRLSIIDLETRSNQPMESHDRRFVITYNGEIYNYLEIREKLKNKGIVFFSDSDTEVIIESYRYYGSRCFSKFNGMWALVIYDRKEKKLIISRDRFGVKPLYYIKKNDMFVFASEIKAIIAAFPEYKEVNPYWIYRYLSGRPGCSDEDDQTAYKDIKVFKPASYLVYNLRSSDYIYRKYWKVDKKKFYEKWIKGKNPYYTFRRLFENAVGIRLRADVEVGSCLSGGIDSSAIIGCVKKKYDKKIQTFSSIYIDKNCNEENYINIVNKKWNLNSHYCRPDNTEYLLDEYIRKITWYHDQPIDTASLYSQYKVMESAANHVKVLLDGQGADELFAGYIPYYSDYIDDLKKSSTLWNKLKAIKYASILKNEWPEMIDYLSTDTIVGLVGIDNAYLFRNDQAYEKIKIKRTSSLFTDSFLSSVEMKDNEGVKLSHNQLVSHLLLDLTRMSIPAILHNEDSNSMAFSIETRIPFLDYRIVEFAIALKGNYKIRNQWTKWIVRRSLKDYLPKQVYKRKGKMGFPAPFSRWLREGQSMSKIRDTIYAFSKRNIILEDTIDFYYKAHISGKCDYSEILFRIYDMEIWLELIGVM